MELALACFRKAFLDLLTEDSLLVLSKGLGIRTIVCKFFKEFAASTYPVFILNINAQEAIIIREMLEADGISRHHLPHIIDADCNTNERKQIYAKGGMVISSAQTLLVDMLANRINCALVNGILVYDAHRVSENSREAFVIRHFKQKNPHGFIKGFTDDAETLTTGFNRLEKILRSLHIYKLQLWPRFHSLVNDEIKKRPIDVVELTQPQTPGMLNIQRALVICMDNCLTELKKSGRLDIDDVTIEAGLFDAFDDIIRRKLSSSGETGLKPRARAALLDLRTLRKLVSYLPRYDAITYYMFLETLRFSALQENRLSTWMMTDAGDKVFKAARSRIYTIEEIQVTTTFNTSKASTLSSSVSGGTTKKNTIMNNLLFQVRNGTDALPGNDPLIVEEIIDTVGSMNILSSSSNIGYTPKKSIRMNLVLEHNPKWTLLKFVLEDIAAAWQKVAKRYCAQNSNKKTTTVTSSSSSSASNATYTSLLDMHQPGSTILIAARDERTCNQLRSILTDGPDTLLHDNLARYLVKNALRSRQQRATVLNTYGYYGHNLRTTKEIVNGNHPTATAATLNTTTMNDEELLLPWYERLTGVSHDERELVLGADLLSLDPKTVLGWKQQYEEQLRKQQQQQQQQQPPPTENHGTENTDEPTTTRSNSFNNVSRVFVSAEQRLLWKQTARMMYHEQAEARKRHEALIKQYEDRMFRMNNDATVNGNSGSLPIIALDDDDDYDGIEALEALQDAMVNEDNVENEGEDNINELMEHNVDEAENSDSPSKPAKNDRSGTKTKRTTNGTEENDGSKKPVKKFKTTEKMKKNLFTVDNDDNDGSEEGVEIVEKDGSKSFFTSSSSSSPSAAKVTSSKGSKDHSAKSVPTKGTTTTKSIPVATSSSSSPITVEWLPRCQIIVYPLSRTDSTYPVLADLRPNFIILYDPDPAFTREIEVYNATIAPTHLRVYMLSYETSSEQAKYVAALKRENEAFERLIHEKAHMAPPPLPPNAQEAALAVQGAIGTASTLVRRVAGGANVDSWGIDTNEMGYGVRNSSTSNYTALTANNAISSGGTSNVSGINLALHTLLGTAALAQNTTDQQQPIDNRPYIIVDMRELRSKLPSLLDHHGIRIEPVTLEVGDYILSPTMVVERKSVPDLYGSMNSGRLYQQAESMCRNYQHPILLIEFDPEKPFSITGNANNEFTVIPNNTSATIGMHQGTGNTNAAVTMNDISADIDIKDIRSKLVLLTIHFPRLRIIWSRSPHATVDIFTTLKKGQPQPDMQQALRMSSTNAVLPDNSTTSTNEDLSALHRITLYDEQSVQANDLLRKLPGITIGNMPAIIAKYPNLVSLAEANEEDLSEILGPGNAALLHAFLHNFQASAGL